MLWGAVNSSILLELLPTAAAKIMLLLSLLLFSFGFGNGDSRVWG